MAMKLWSRNIDQTLKQPCSLCCYINDYASPHAWYWIVNFLLRFTLTIFYSYFLKLLVSIPNYDQPNRGDDSQRVNNQEK